jgi:hypothetical protein
MTNLIILSSLIHIWKVLIPIMILQLRSSMSFFLDL